MYNIRKKLARIIYPTVFNANTEIRDMYNDTHKELMRYQKINKEIKNRNIELRTEAIDIEGLRKYNNKLMLEIALLKQPDNKINLNINTWIKKAEVNYLLKKEFPNAQIFLSDNKYGLINKNQFTNIILKDKTNIKEYVTESLDCDDFSFQLMGNVSNYDIPFGILWISKPYYHAINIAILKGKIKPWEIWIVEPQDDRIYKKPKNYVGDLIII